MEKNPTMWRKIEKQSNPKLRIRHERKLVLWYFGFNKPSSGLRNDVIKCC